jgi:hypothetical protein
VTFARMHRMPENDGALFQVASQFNLLEMTAPSITSEQGVARYQLDRTQGPACAIAAGAATIYRNYFAQTPERQLDAARCPAAVQIKTNAQSQKFGSRWFPPRLRS